jgi:PST family polysaccharide transporter
MKNQPTQNNKLLTSFNCILSVNIVSGAINFFAIAWFARHLGPSIMGTYAVIITVLQITTAFLSAGFDQAVIRSPKDNSLIEAANLATVGQSVLLFTVGGLVYLIYFFHSPNNAEQILLPYFLVLSSIIVTFWGSLFAAPLAANMEYPFLSVIKLISSSFGVFIGIFLTLSEASLHALAYRDFIASTTFFVIVLVKSPNRNKWNLNINRPGLNRLFKFSVGMWGLNLLERVVRRIDYALIGFLFGKDSLGIYFVVRGLVEGVLAFLVNPIQTVLYSHYCRVRDLFTWRKDISIKVTCLYWVVGGILLLFSIHIVPYILNLILGQEYLLSNVIIPGLFIYAWSIIWFENIKVIAMSQHIHHKLVIARIVQLGILLISIYPLTYALGLLGASLSTGLAALSLSFLATLQIYLKTKYFNIASGAKRANKI